MKKLALVVLCGLVLASCSVLQAAECCSKKAQPLFGEKLSNADYESGGMDAQRTGRIDRRQRFRHLDEG